MRREMTAEMLLILQMIAIKMHENGKHGSYVFDIMNGIGKHKDGRFSA